MEFTRSDGSIKKYSEADVSHFIKCQATIRGKTYHQSPKLKELQVVAAAALELQARKELRSERTLIGRISNGEETFGKTVKKLTYWFFTIVTFGIVYVLDRLFAIPTQEQVQSKIESIKKRKASAAPAEAQAVEAKAAAKAAAKDGEGGEGGAAAAKDGEGGEGGAVAAAAAAKDGEGGEGGEGGAVAAKDGEGGEGGAVEEVDQQ